MNPALVDLDLGPASSRGAVTSVDVADPLSLLGFRHIDSVMHSVISLLVRQRRTDAPVTRELMTRELIKHLTNEVE